MVEPEHDLGRNIEVQDENLLQVADQNSNLLQVEKDQDEDQFLDLEQEEQDDEQVKLYKKLYRCRVSQNIPSLRFPILNQAVPKYIWILAMQGVQQFLLQYRVFRNISRSMGCFRKY